MAQAFSPEYKILTDFQSVIALQDEWEDLCRRSTRHYLAQSFTWFRASWETTAAPRGDRLYCLVIRVAGKIRLIWPFVIFRAGGVKVARPLPQATEYCTVLVEDGPDAERYVAAAWKMVRKTCGCDVISLRNVRDETALYRVVTNEWGLKAVRADVAPWLCWDGIANPSAYLKKRQQPYKRRRLSKQGVVKFEILTDAVACEAAIDWILQHKRRWFDKHNIKNDWMRSRECRDFFHQLVAAEGSHCGLHVFVLTLDSKIIAGELSAIDQHRVESFTGTYDNDFFKYSPGALLTENCIQWGLDEHRHLHYDMRVGGEDYKYIWANRIATTFYFDYANTIRGFCYILLMKLPPFYLLTARSKIGQMLSPRWRLRIKAIEATLMESMRSLGRGTDSDRRG